MTTCKAHYDGVEPSSHAMAPANEMKTSTAARGARCRPQPCDRCRKYRRVCNFKQPCTDCLVSQDACVYSWRLQTIPASSDQRLSLSEIEVSSPFPHPSTRPESTSIFASAFDFLIHFTMARGFASTFDNDHSFHRLPTP